MNRPLVSVVKIKKPIMNIDDPSNIYHNACGYHDCIEDVEQFYLNSERLAEVLYSQHYNGNFNNTSERNRERFFELSKHIITEASKWIVRDEKS